MDRNSYLKELEKNLSVLSKEERDEAIKYYEEYFDEAGVENENAVMSDFGTPQKLASNILKEYNIRSENNEKVDYDTLSTNIKENTEKVKRNANKNVVVAGLIVAILVFGFPVYFPIFMTCIGIAIVFFASGVALAIAGITCLMIAGTMIVGNVFSALLVGGIGLMLLAVGLVLSIVLTRALIKFIPWAIRTLVDLFQKVFGV